ncbi:hypothetical protein ABZV31_29100 [Streptomyces sp. NPDC005202]|uniref:hypothetical protein n=1 Tax=Streptomyces sp. NPDC005202 TaxID=3157021 RepID=UPI0033BBF597
MTEQFFPPFETAQLIAEDLRGKLVLSPQAGPVDIVEAQGDSQAWPITVRFSAESQKWPSPRSWEVTFEEGDILSGESVHANAAALAENAVTLLLETLATGVVGGIREVNGEF